MAAVVGFVGLILAGVIWRIARRQANRERMFATGQDPMATWLPLWGFGRDRTDGSDRPLVRAVFEVATAGYFAVLGWRLGFSLDLVMIICFTAPILVIGLVDFWTRLIHTNVIYVGMALGWGFAVLDGFRSLLDSLLGMAIGAGIFLFFFVAAFLIYRNLKVVPFGLGYVYLAAMIGAMVRVDLVMRALFLGIALAAVILLALLAARVLSRKQAVAYGPYLCLGALLTLVIS